MKETTWLAWHKPNFSLRILPKEGSLEHRVVSELWRGEQEAKNTQRRRAGKTGKQKTQELFHFSPALNGSFHNILFQALNPRNKILWTQQELKLKCHQGRERDLPYFSLFNGSHNWVLSSQKLKILSFFHFAYSRELTTKISLPRFVTQLISNHQKYFKFLFTLTILLIITSITTKVFVFFPRSYYSPSLICTNEVESQTELMKVKGLSEDLLLSNIW